MSSRLYPDRPIVGVGAVVLVTPADRHIPGLHLEAGRRVVLIRRRSEPLAGQWSLPGGLLEVGETLAAGVAREVFEETGLTVHVGPVVDVVDRIIVDPDGRVRYHFALVDYLCRPVGGALRPGSDASEVAVASPDALEPFGLTGDTMRVVERAAAMRA